MRRRRRGFAVVVDEYGGFAGVLTINDLVSELVGDLHDEYDRSPSPAIVRIDARRHLVDGSTSVDDVRDDLGCPIPDGEYVTIGGFLLDALERIPEEGAVLERDGWTYRVARMEGRRIAKVVVEGPSATISAVPTTVGNGK
jgi:putative hemolysin